MPLLAIFVPVLSWLLRVVVVKFVVFTAIFALMAIFIPMGIALLVPHLGVSSLNSAFAVVDSGVWWVLDYFALDYGIPLLISAAVSRFLIRRLPVIG